PETAELLLLASPIVVHQVRHIARGAVGKPLVGVGNANLVEDGESVSRRLSLILDQGRKKLFADRRRVGTSQSERLRVGIPLDGVSEQMAQQEETLFRSEGVIDVNLDTIEIARERIGNVTSDHP